MKNLTAALYLKKAGSDFSSDIGGRLYKGQARAGATYPYAVVMVVTNVPDKTFTEDYEDVTVQFSLFSSASGTTEVENMYTHLKALYDECSLTITGSTLIWMQRSNAAFIVEDHTTVSGTQRVWAWHVDYDIKTVSD